MSEETVDNPPNTDRPAEKYVSRLLYASYAVTLMLSVLILLIGIALGSFMEVVIAVPVIFILIDTLFIERTVVHIPPFMVFLMVGLMILIVASGTFGDGHLLSIIVDYLFGVVMGVGGLIATYSLMNTIPGMDINREKPVKVAFISVSVALAMFTIVLMVQYYLSLAANIETDTANEIMNQLLFVMFGALSVSAVFYLGKHSIHLRRTVTRYLENNAATLGIEEYEAMEIEKAIKSGEGEKVEYKSTFRTNLATGEKDPRMEKAVLKTLVAFLNSRGGTLLIGVGDDGTVVGIDESSFDSRDKLNLHLTNLIASQIGNEFLPFITFRLSDYQGKGVMRVVCRKSDGPVFLKEGKQETFYVRSGPSSVELHGMDTLNYVENRFKRRRKMFEN
ncbi:MAG: ATP-binding protein [Candidatus Methanoplasma sp.]|jgi:hypothetical protein|nr:ATP-binding protein [Candidatus Methanoplasma sp.]